MTSTWVEGQGSGPPDKNKAKQHTQKKLCGIHPIPTTPSLSSTFATKLICILASIKIIKIENVQKNILC